MGTIAQLRVVDAKSTAANYFASLLHAIASMVLALLLPTFVLWCRHVAAEHAPGLAAIAGGMLESFFSLRFGIFFLLFFSCFYRARQSSKPGLRIAFFWIRASLVTALGLALRAGFIHVMRLAAGFNPLRCGERGF